jgi:sigma-B regulation protein RsbU (phosphoserine phosphatase)
MRIPAIGNAAADWVAELGERQSLSWAAGEVLFRQGEEADCAYLLESGEVEVIVDTPLGSLAIAVAAPPQIIGEIALFCDAPRSATVVAKSAVTALRLTREALIEAAQRSPAAAHAIISGLGRRLAGQNASVALLSTAARALGEGKADAAAVARLLEEADRKGPLSTIFRQVVAAIEAKRMHEMELELAAKVQRAILPKRLENEDFALEGEMRSAKEVGGDFYDFFIHFDDHVVFVIGDVSGKGVPASLFAASTRSALRSLSLVADDPAQTVRLTNRFLAESNHENLFVTLFVGDLNLENGLLTYCNAGHEAPFILRAGAVPLRLPPTGPAVGILDSFDYEPHTIQLEPGDLLFAITDGVTDAVDAEDRRFGEERLDALLTRAGSRPAAELIADAFAALAAFEGGTEPFDDITFLALSYHPA